jgi:hypothetical protein
MKTQALRFCAVIALGAWGMNRAAATAPSALAVFNAWLTTAAQADPHWRTDIRAETEAAEPGAGRYLARSPVLGPFSYRPKVYAELRPEERLRLLREPAVQRLLRRRPRRLRFAIPPEEMRQNRPFVFQVPPP